MSDLADRISRAAVAALDLAPFDDRYGRLSRQVLAGGASRFSRVTADDQAIHFVIPVGLAGERIDYGALVLQDRQAGLIWRDAAGIDHTATVQRRPETKTSFSSLTLGGEQWMRFDVDPDGEDLTFLVPPVNSPLLRSTLVDFFRARPGQHRPDAVVPEPEPHEPPMVRFPDPEPESEPELEPDVETTAEDLEATQLMEAHVSPAEPAASDAPDVPEPQLIGSGDPESTQLAPAEHFAAEPALLNEWAPDEIDEATRVRPVAPPLVDESTRVHEPPFDLYRDAPAAPPQTPPAWSVQPTEALPAQNAPAQEQPWAYQSPAPGGWQQGSAQVQTIESAPVYAQPSGSSRTTVGFLLGLFGTLAVGGVVIIAKLLGAF